MSLGDVARALLRVPASRLYPSLARLACRVLRVGQRFGQPWDALERVGILPVPIHFYQPYPTERDLQRSGFWSGRSEMPGVHMDLTRSAELLTKLGSAFGAECSWPRTSNDPRTYHTSNVMFGFCSAAVAHCMVRTLRPRRIIEVGSGYSTHILGGAMGMNAQQEGGGGEIISIEPFPGEILDTDIPHVTQRLRKRVEDVEASLFAELRENDLLFVDSSHIMRYGGDVLYLYLEVLPRLHKGVHVHIHDVHLPFAYPPEYFRAHRWIWNEQYLLQALLSESSGFDVLIPCWYLHKVRDSAFRAAFAQYDPALHRPSSSFWMRRT